MGAVLNGIVAWSIAAMAFFIAIAPAPANVFMGFVIVFFLIGRAVQKKTLFFKSSINLPLFFFFAVTCVSLLHSANIKDSLRGGILREALFILVLFAIAQEMKNKKQYWAIFFSIAAGLLLLGIDSIWQVLTHKDFIRGYDPVINIGIVRATASFKDPNTLGIYLSAFAPLVAGFTLYYFYGKKRIVMAFISVAALAGIALTYSRPTILALYIALWVFALIKRTRVVIIALALVTLLSPFIAPASVKNWAKSVDYNFLRFMCNDDRIAIYRNTLNMIRQHPVIGLGVNTYMKNYRFYKEVPEYRNVVTTDYAYGHNNFLHLTAETGLLGLLAFLWLIGAVLKEGWLIYKRLDDPFFKMYALSLLVCIIAFLVNGLTESSLFYSRVAVIFWYLVGLLVSLSKSIVTAKSDHGG